MPAARPTSPEELIGWKAIAAYLRVSVRTAQDFERSRGLPVRRGAGIRAPVFAVIAELQEWKRSPDRKAVQPTGADEALVDSDSSSAEISLPISNDGTPTSKLLAGHLLHITSAATLSGAMFATTVVMELAYAYDRYHGFVWKAVPVILLATFGCFLVAAVINWHCVCRTNSHGLKIALLVMTTGAAINYLVIRPLLPSFPVTLASFQTWTAQAAYLKGVVYCTLFSAFFFLVPFNFVAALQCDLRGGMHQFVFELLTRNKAAVAPRGAPFLPVSLLWSMLVVGAVYSLVSTAHLLEALKLTPYTNLFILTIQIRWMLFLLLGVQCCWWYYSALADLKRECIATVGLTDRDTRFRPKMRSIQTRLGRE